MANKFTTKVTNEGITLLQEASQQDKKVEFINAIASSTAYSESQLISETYDDINSRASKNQTGTINNITIDKNITRMELVFDGHDVKSDYTLNSIFLIAKLKDSQDLKLFAVIKANQPQYMNSYDGSGSTNLQINLGVKFSNNDRVTLQVDTAAIATLGDLSNLRNETQTKLDKETSRATEKETSLQKDLEIEKNRASQSEIELQNKIDSEISRAQKTEKDITASLSAEKNRAIQVENDLSGRITTEQNRAMSRENYIDVKIDKEKDRATSKENSLEQSLDTERRRATDAENTLSGRININHNDVVARYNVLNNSIDIEKNRAMTKDNSLDKRIDGVQKSVTDEQTRATTKENEIANNLQSVKNSLDDLQVGGTNLLKKTSNDWKTWTGTGWANNTVDNGPITLEPGTYTFRAEIDNTGNTQRGVQSEIFVATENVFLDKIAKSYTKTSINAGSKGYTTITFTIDKTLTDVRIYPHAAVNSAITDTATIKWRREKLEKGNMPTDWSLNPEEINSNIQSAANDARTSAKNDAINAIKSDSQWQSMGKIVTNASFLQNANGFAQEVVKTTTPMISGGGVNLLKDSLIPLTASNVWIADGVSNQIVDDYVRIRGLGDNNRIYQPFSNNGLNADGYYSISFWASNDGNNEEFDVQVGTWSSLQTVHVTGSFKLYKLENVWLGGNPTFSFVAPFNKVVRLKKIKLEKGTIATDWSPAPEDLATKLQLNQVIDTTNNMQKQITDETSRATKAEKDIKDLANSNKSRLDAKDAHIFIDNKSDDVANIFDVRDKYNTKNVIQSLVGDEWGSAVGIGNAGLTVIGGGESSSSILHHVKNQTAIDGTVYQPQNEELFLASDSNVKIITNTQDSSNPANYKVTNFDTNGNMKLPGDVYINGGSYSISDMFKFMEAPNLIYNSEFMVDHGVISGWNDFTNINSQEDGYLGSKALYITAPMRANSPTEADTRIFYSKEIKGLGRYPNSRPKIFSLSFKIMPLSYKTFSKDLYIIPYFSFNNGSEISIENSIIKAGSSTQTWYNFEKIFTINDSYDNGFRIKFKIIGISQTNVLLSQPMLSATPIPIPYKPNYGNIADFMVGGVVNYFENSHDKWTDTLTTNGYVFERCLISDPEIIEKMKGKTIRISTEFKENDTNLNLEFWYYDETNKRISSGGLRELKTDEAGSAGLYVNVPDKDMNKLDFVISSSAITGAHIKLRNESIVII